MHLKIEKRLTPSRWLTLTAPIFSLALALLAIALVFLGYGVNPLLAYKRIFAGAFGSLYGVSETIVKAIPLIMCGVGLAIAFRALVWNIGAEGQLLIGAVAATWVALYAIPNAPRLLLLSSMFAAGFAGGAIWGFIPGILKAKLKASETMISLMMVYIASELVKYLVYGPWKGADEWGFPYSSKFPPAAQIPRLLNSRIHYITLILAIVLAGLGYILLIRTKLGYEIKVTGGNPGAAKYAGISYSKIVILVMAISGGLAGLAGVGEVAGIHHRLRYPGGISPGYGFTAIIVAWLGRLNPLAIIIISLLFGGLLVGGDAIQVALGLPVATINLFNGSILFFFLLTNEFFTRYKLTLKGGKE